MRRSIHIRTGVTKPGKKDAALCKTSRIFINLIPAVKVAVNPHFHDVLAGILVPFLKNVVRNLVFQTKQLEGLAMEQGLCLKPKVKTFPNLHYYTLLKYLVCSKGRYSKV